MQIRLKQLGPGLLFAGAAIGVSHLVLSTRAGADYGFGLLWALLLVHLFKYPFFQYGPRYAAATQETLLHGYAKLGKAVLLSYLILNLATMFTIQAAVTIVTAGLAASMFGNLEALHLLTVEGWSIIILISCLILLLFGKYKVLDKTIKGVIVVLTLSTILATIFAYGDFPSKVLFEQIIPENKTELAFLIAFMGWMPAPLDISIWHSIWTVEKKKLTGQLTPRTALLDFNIGFIGTIILGAVFLCLGYFVMYNSEQTFSESALSFSEQLIDMYTKTLGSWSYALIGLAALTTMFSTTITTLDASPRAMSTGIDLLFKKPKNYGYLIWILVLTLGTILIFFLFNSEMGLLIKIATILSFVTAPFYAILNFYLITGRHTPKAWKPKIGLRVLSWLGILFLLGFSGWYLSSL